MNDLLLIAKIAHLENVNSMQRDMLELANGLILKEREQHARMAYQIALLEKKLAITKYVVSES